MQHELLHETLDQNDLAEVLQRAQTLETRNHSSSGVPDDLKSFMRAAEELGIDRQAVLLALREKFGHPLEGIAVGDRVFAKSADCAFYTATVSQLQDGTACVRFLNGGDHTLALTDLRGFSLMPGQELEANWPLWGWYAVKVEKYDPLSEPLLARSLCECSHN